jgi:hypothetical protein
MDLRAGDDAEQSTRPDEPPFDALTSQPPEFGEPRSSVLTPMGEVESIGGFARGLGVRRTKIAIFGGGAVLFVLALLAAL